MTPQIKAKFTLRELELIRNAIGRAWAKSIIGSIEEQTYSNLCKKLDGIIKSGGVNK